MHEISVKKLGEKLKIRVEKVVLLFYYFLIFLPFYLKNSESSPMVDIIILNPIGSYKIYFGFTFFVFEAHFLPQNFSNGPLKLIDSLMLLIMYN